MPGLALVPAAWKPKRDVAAAAGWFSLPPAIAPPSSRGGCLYASLLRQASRSRGTGQAPLVNQRSSRSIKLRHVLHTQYLGLFRGQHHGIEPWPTLSRTAPKVQAVLPQHGERPKAQYCHPVLADEQAFLPPSDAARPRTPETVYIVQPETVLQDPVT